MRIYGKDYFGFVYLWRDKKRKMFYIGSHMGAEDDGYVCSSKRMRQAYLRRPDTFHPRKIVYWHETDDRDALLREEKRWLDMIKDEELGKKYYNTKRNAWGCSATELRSQLKNRWSDSTFREKMQKIHKKSWKENGERRKAVSSSMSKRWSDVSYRKRSSEFNSRAALARWKDEEYREHMTLKLANARRGRSWYNDGVNEKLFIPSRVPRGWKKGRVIPLS